MEGYNILERLACRQHDRGARDVRGFLRSRGCRRVAVEPGLRVRSHSGSAQRERAELARQAEFEIGVGELRIILHRLIAIMQTKINSNDDVERRGEIEVARAFGASRP